MPAIVKLVAIVACIFLLVPLGVVSLASLLLPSARLSQRIVRARGDILLTAAALGGTVLLAGTVSTGYALIVGVTLLLVVFGRLVSELLRGHRMAAQHSSGAAMVVPRPGTHPEITYALNRSAVGRRHL